MRSGQLRQRLADRGCVIAAAHHPGPLRARKLLDAGKGIAEQRPLRREGKELLGAPRAGKRPEARPASPREQYGVRAQASPSTGSSANSSNWRRMRAVAPQMTVPRIVYQVS